MKKCYNLLVCSTLIKKQMKFLGHISRKNGIEKLVLCGKVEGEEVEAEKENYTLTALKPLQQSNKRPTPNLPN